jgi:hypothetical protein
MKTVVAIALLTAVGAASAQAPYVAANAPPDKLTHIAGQQLSDFDLAIKPYVEQARSSYPAAKQRFEAGLPRGQSFFITTRIFETPTRFEQVFVAVQRIEDGMVYGRVWSDIRLLTKYRQGDYYTFPESDMIDWLITQPDGSEEGNYVGKFLDTYQAQ